MPHERSLFARYLDLLGVLPGPPDIDQLARLVRAHLIRVPFENLSKLFYLQNYGLRDIPDLGRYLDGIESNGFGGTCYSNNVYFYFLLRFLGYDVSLCGADMSEPDVHIVLMLSLSGRELMVDVGYGAPFFEPLPRDLSVDHEIIYGNERWVLKPQDADGSSRIEHYRLGELIHGYRAKPQPRDLSFFAPAIAASFREDSTFMNTVRVVRFFDGSSLAISNSTLVEATQTSCSIRSVGDRDTLVLLIEKRFGIPEVISREAIR